MSKVFLCLSLILLVDVAVAFPKRSKDSPSVSIRGGGKIGGARRFPIRRPSQPLLLQVEASGDETAPYSFLQNATYAQCYENDVRGQGDFCNSCWAFSVKNMVQARNCKRAIDRNGTLEKVSPLNMICKLQASGFCATNDIGESLGFAVDHGLVKKTWLNETLTRVPQIKKRREKKEKQESEDLAESEWREGHKSRTREWTGETETTSALELSGDRASGNSEEEQLSGNSETWLERASRLAWEERMAGIRATEILSEDPEALIDVSNPIKSFCDELFPAKETDAAKDKAPAPLIRIPEPDIGTADGIKTWIQNGGPVIGTIRLTWEFMNFTGSLLDTKGNMTFCRPFIEGDKDDYCSPHKRADWNPAQENQQNETNQENWYNHFVTIHGWGVKKSTVPGGRDISYWVVENSWGRQYDNDPSLGNNGAGVNYDEMKSFENDEEMKHFVNKNHFLLIADDIAGKGGLEMTSRNVYYFN